MTQGPRRHVDARLFPFQVELSLPERLCQILTNRLLHPYFLWELQEPGGQNLRGNLSCDLVVLEGLFFAHADLAENVKEYDRATVRGVLFDIDRAGYQIVPRTSSTSERTSETTQR